MLALALVLAVGSTVMVDGRVTDASGRPLAGASVYVRGGDAFAVTDEAGRFALETMAGAILVATFPGLKAAEAEARPQSSAWLVLGAPSHAETVTVSARADAVDVLPKQRLSWLQVRRMPGAAADPLRAVQMLPGVAKVDDGAGLFVRGGDVSETATFLDRARVPHPYRAESASGGLFGTVPTMLVSGVSLATGGFPARYGGVLSAVLELESLGPPSSSSFQTTLGLAGASALVSRTIGPRWSARVFANHTDTTLLFAVNPPEQAFTDEPTHTDASVSLHGNVGAAGRVRLFALADREAVGVDVEEEAFRGALDSNRRHGLVALAWERAIGGRWLLAATASGGGHQRELRVGVLDLDTTETGRRLRVDAAGPLRGMLVRTGIEAESEGFRRRGIAPVRGGDLAGVSGRREWDQTLRASRLGAYAEVERTLGPLAVNVGARADRYAPLDGASLDPRVSAVWSVRRDTRLRVAAGRFHQAPAPAYLDATFGNRGLGLMRARHLAIGLEHGNADGPLLVRLEAYDKAYGGLPVEDVRLRFDDDGDGVARGLDALVAVTRATVEGFIGYSYLHARRRHTPFEERGRHAPSATRVPPAFAVPHTLHAAGRVALPASLSLGLGVRVASGAPFTPIVGARPGASGGFEPVYAAQNSDRLPPYRRVDLALSRLQALAGGTLVLFAGLTNALDQENVFEYAYSPDYTERRPVASNWGRSLYVGASFGR